ncbi:MAG: Gfo/Idh/MocA family protein [Capsulimonadaceae bacterium]
MSTRVLIGILSAAHMHAESYARVLSSLSEPSIGFSGVADSDRKRGEALAGAFGARCFDTAEALVAAGAQAVIVCGENARHRSLVDEALAAGATAILCEKPLATTRDDAEAMIGACAAAGVPLATAFSCRYAPAFTDALATVQSGKLGDLLAICATNRGKNPGGWFTDPALSGGGAVIDHTVHVADLNRLLLGREASRVYAEIGSGFSHADCEDTGMLTIDYTGGVFATLDTSWSRPRTYPFWGDLTLQVVGTGGVMDVDLFGQTLVHYDDRGVTWAPWGSDADTLMLLDFARLASGQEPRTLATGEDGLRALDIALAAYRSASTGQPVLLD